MRYLITYEFEDEDDKSAILFLDRVKDALTYGNAMDDEEADKVELSSFHGDLQHVATKVKHD